MDFSSYFQAGSKSRSVGLGLSRRPPSAGQAPLAALRGSLGLDVYLSCETDVYIYHALWSSGLSWLIKRILFSPLGKVAGRAIYLLLLLLLHNLLQSYWRRTDQGRVHDIQKISEGSAIWFLRYERISTDKHVPACHCTSFSSAADPKGVGWGKGPNPKNHEKF